MSSDNSNLEPELTVEEVSQGDRVMVIIDPPSDSERPVHAFLPNRAGKDDRYHYYYVPWGPRFENPIPEGSNWRYGYQAVEKWGEENVVIKKAIIHNR